MKDFLVVIFNRYETSKSSHNKVTAPNQQEALAQVWELDEDEKEEVFEDLEIENVDDTFSCISGEEEDILFYLL